MWGCGGEVRGRLCWLRHPAVKYHSHFVLAAGQFSIDHADPAIRGALVLEDGQLMWPAPALPMPAAPPPPPVAAKPEAKGPKDLYPGGCPRAWASGASAMLASTRGSCPHS